MSENLVIVESPAKAKTIQKFLSKDYVVKSSFGHIRDLPKKGLNVEINNNFNPIYAISSDKKKIVAELKKLAKNHQVWLASDEDREGEAISWHLSQALNLDPKSTKRIVFHEITKSAIIKALDNPRTIDLKLVNAQQARRILDRIVGYELSPVLWKKIQKGLSAGRVQSVAVRLIVDRERKINDTKINSYFKILAEFEIPDNSKTLLQAELNARFNNLEEAKSWLEKIKNESFTIKSITEKDSIKQPGAPFTTSTLQQEASKRLNFSVKQTMLIAQKLYESGHITYMRTDSTILSDQALNGAKSYILTNFSEKYYHYRQFKTKNTNAQEAHEAIRPTNFNKLTITSDDNSNRLYNLIWQRTIASQMASAKLLKTEAIINISNNKELFIANGEVIIFKGFLEVYSDNKNDHLLPSLEKIDSLNYQTISAVETFNRPPARFSEASLVKTLEELGIGRPSTYAPTISTIQSRGYIEKVNLEGKNRDSIILTLDKDGKIVQDKISRLVGSDKNKLMPTAIAEVTTDFLVKHFPSIVDYDFTAKVETEFDKIANGSEQWVPIIKTFYDSFHPLIEKAETITRKEASQARLLGVDPVSKKNIYARFGRFGPMLQKGDGDETDDKPIFATMPKDTTINTITLQQALEMFKLPRLLGQTTDGEDIITNIGRFGPYVNINKTFVSIKGFDPHTITKEEALTLYQEKIDKDKAKIIKIFEKSEIKIIHGPYGPYITNGQKNAKIPKETDPAGITESQAIKMLKEAPHKSKKRKYIKNK